MLDLYQTDIAENLSRLKPVDDVEPGAFTNFFRGAGLSAMKTFAEVPRAVSMANSLIPVIADKLGGTGTVLTDKYFKMHDQVFGSAVDYWTPKPNEVGVAGEITGKLLSMLPMIIANPAMVVGATQFATAEDLVKKHPDVTATEANLVGGVQAAGLGLGIWMPILGQNLWQRVLLGGAGFNVAQGVATRGISAAILGDKKAAKEFAAFDGTALTLDVLLGMAFGAVAHVVPGQRKQGAEAWERINQWAKGLKPTEIDALLVLREAQHINQDSMPGKPVSEQDVAAHVDRMRQAIDQMARDEPIEVQDIKVPRGTVEPGDETIAPRTDAVVAEGEPITVSREPQFTPEPAHVQEAARAGAELMASGEQVRATEGLPRAEDQRVVPPRDITPLDPVQQAEAVGQHIERQLLGTGMQRGEAATNAAIWSAFAKSAYDRYGIPPSELMARYGVDVQRMNSADQLIGALEQARQVQTDTPAFRNWFGDSKVVDAAGKPLVVYHGTPDATFDVFKDESFFSPDPEIAGRYTHPSASSIANAAKTGDARAVYPVFLNIRQPFDTRIPAVRKLFDREFFGKYGNGTPIGNKGLPDWTDARDIAEWINETGQKFDGIIVDEGGFPNDAGGVTDRGISYVPMRGDQIKSAIGNRGTFDPKNPNILFQSDQPFYSELGRQVDYLKMAAAPAKGWKDTLKGLASKGVVRPAEIEATGLNEWLDLQPGKVTKEQVQEFLAQNGVRVEEVELGGGTKPFDRDDFYGTEPEADEAAEGVIQDYSVRVPHSLTGRIEYLNVTVYKTDDPQVVSFDINDSGSVRYSERTAKSLNHIMRGVEKYLTDNYGAAFTGKAEAPAPKFSQYQLPGGQNYRELLLTLPTERSDPSAAMAKHGYTPQLDSTGEIFTVTHDASGKVYYNPADAEEGSLTFSQIPSTYVMKLAEGRAIDDTKNFRSSHFDQPNILAHIRFNDRTDADGKRVLFIEEIQSDWAQKGKREGFDTGGQNMPEFLARATYEPAGEGSENWRWSLPDGTGGIQPSREAAERAAAESLNQRQRVGVPSAPFVGKTEAWVALSLKRMIRYGAENGFDRVAWTTGEQQVGRYTSALRKQVDSIEWTKTKDGVQLVGYKGTGSPDSARVPPEVVREARSVLAENDNLGFDSSAEAMAAVREHADWFNRWDVPHADRIAIENYIDAFKASGRAKTKVVDTTEKESVLSDAIGKAMADKIKNDPAQSGVIEGADIKIDDTGMATFYDRIVPNIANDVLKKLGGGRVGEVRLPIDTFVDTGTLTAAENARWLELNGMNNRGELAGRRNRALADEHTLLSRKREEGQSMQELDTPQAGFEITPALRSRAMEGMPLFQTGARGAVNFETGRTLISLFEKADKSTFQHETAHTFLEMTKDLASREGVPIAAVQDWATLANWLKIEGGSIPREAHEQFARGWEKYLAEGVAPNEGLKTAFKRFRDWLIDIYKSLVNIDAPLNNQIRGVMARMLDSQARDPIVKGGLDDPRLLDPEYRQALEAMGREAGWAQIGGSILRERAGHEAEGAPAEGNVIGRTEWIPHAEWYARMQASAANMPGVGGASVRAAVGKALMGEKMSAPEKRAVMFMLDEHVKVIKELDEAHAAEINPEADPFEFANTMHAEGIEPTRENLIDMVAIDRARELDSEAFENIPNHFDDHQYMVAIGEIIDAKRKTEKIDQGRGADAQSAEDTTGQTESVAPRTSAGSSGPPPHSGGVGEASGAAAPPNMAAQEARRIAVDNPDMKIVVGTETNGDSIYKTLNELLDDAEAEAALARQDIQLITVAAECLLGVA